MSNSTDILVIGGGVIGLSCAWHLAEAGVGVTVLDASYPGQASYAAAGMLAPLPESTSLDYFLAMALQSLAYWPSFVEQVRDSCTAPLAIYGPGTLRLAQTEQEAEEIESTFQWQRALGLPLEMLSAADIRDIEPRLTGSACAGIISPKERLVEPRILLQALREACAARGVTIKSGEAAVHFDATGKTLNSVSTPTGHYAAEGFLIAGGAWSSQIASLLHQPLTVSPLRGQIVTLGPTPVPHFAHTLQTTNGYMLPRPDGRIVVGATEEQAGFDVQPTVEGMAAQLQTAVRLIPSLAPARFDSMAVGLRPASPDGLPVLGALPYWNNISVASGHGRNGILLTPLTGQWVANYLLHKKPLPEAVSLERFHTEQQCLSF